MSSEVQLNVQRVLPIVYKDAGGFIAAVARALQKEPAPLSDCELRFVGGLGAVTVGGGGPWQEGWDGFCQEEGGGWHFRSCRPHKTLQKEPAPLSDCELGYVVVTLRGGGEGVH
jgi:hypothetical protein